MGRDVGVLFVLCFRFFLYYFLGKLFSVGVVFFSPLPCVYVCMYVCFLIRLSFFCNRWMWMEGEMGFCKIYSGGVRENADARRCRFSGFVEVDVRFACGCASRIPGQRSPVV